MRRVSRGRIESKGCEREPLQSWKAARVLGKALHSPCSTEQEYTIHIINEGVHERCMLDRKIVICVASAICT
jgi:hypothetical protein